jgi:hypothetical protein
MYVHISILLPIDSKTDPYFSLFPFGMLQQWIEDGPWDEPKQKTIDLDEDIVDLDDDDEDMTAPTFSQWVRKLKPHFPPILY